MKKYRILEVEYCHSDMTNLGNIQYSNGEIKYFIQYKCCGLIWLKLDYGEFYYDDASINKYKSLLGSNFYAHPFNDLDEAKKALKWLNKDKRCLLGINTNKDLLYLFEKESNELIPKIYGSKNYNEAKYLLEEKLKSQYPIKPIKKRKIYI